MDKIKFDQLNDWFVSENIYRLRLELINKEINEINLSKHYKEKFIKSRVGSMCIIIGKFMARLKPITDTMLSNYILGIFGIPLSVSRDNEEFNIQVDNLINPAFSILGEYIKSDDYRLSLIKQEVSGDEVFRINGLEIPLSYNAILLHIKRTNSLPLKPADIANIQKDFVNFKRDQFTLAKQKDKEEFTEKDKNTYPAKYYALFHLMLVEMGLEKHFERDFNDRYNRKAIEEFAKNRYPGISPQGFYNGITKIDITNRLTIRNIFGNEYKKIIIKISNNDAKIIDYLKRFPN